MKMNYVFLLSLLQKTNKSLLKSIHTYVAVLDTKIKINTFFSSN